MTLKTIIVEDEPLSRMFLNNLLQEFCPEVDIVYVTATEEDAITAIRKLQPDLIFLDIELLNGNGFAVLQQTLPGNFQVIFTTALDHYAVNIIRICGVDYIQKPIDMDSLRQALKSVQNKRNSTDPQLALKHLLQAFNNNNKPLHLLLPGQEELTYIPLGDIIHIEMVADSCRFNLKSGRQISAAVSLKEYETLLQEHSFFRIHQYHLVNIKEVNEGTTGPDNFVVMTNGQQIPLSDKRKEGFYTVLNTSRHYSK